LRDWADLLLKSQVRSLSLHSDELIAAPGFAQLCAGLPSSLQELRVSGLALSSGAKAAGNSVTELLLPLCNRIADPSSSLQVLQLDHSELGADESAVQALGHSLFCSPLLSLLELRHSSLGDAGVKSLFGAFLNSTKKPFEAGAVGGSSEAARCFSALNLHDNEIGDEGASALGLALGSGRLAINELTLRGNLIGSVGASSLADGLIQSENALAALTELSLASNQIGDVGASALSLALANPGCALSKLDLENNSISDAGVASLSSAIANDICTLADLNLASNAIGDVGGCALGHALKFSKPG